VLHKGLPAFEGAFGRRVDGTPMTGDTRTWMASITKLLTGVLVMQFVDAGIVDLDAPLGEYLPELGPRCPLTLRHLMTHTSGLSWAGEWASDWNASMENQVLQSVPFLQPGREFSYHRAGYALASKVLERLSGSTVPALFQEYLFDPLGMGSSYADNTYGGLYATAGDLSRLGEMLLERGRLGDVRFLSGEAWAAMLPRPLLFGEKQLQRSWGIGCSPQGGKGLSDSTFGHAAASGALLRIDPAHQLVVVLGRDGIGPDRRQYDRFVEDFLHAVTAPWEGDRGHE
jgi:CubicO group peptidase (beta-lactamase class C family)